MCDFLGKSNVHINVLQIIKLFDLNVSKRIKIYNNFRNMIIDVFERSFLSDSKDFGVKVT